MLKYVILFCIIYFCNADPEEAEEPGPSIPARKLGDYDELALLLRFPVTQTFYVQMYRNHEPEDFQLYLTKNRPLLESYTWVVYGLWAYKGNKLVANCTDFKGNKLQLNTDYLDNPFKHLLRMKWPSLVIDGGEKREWRIDYEFGSCINEDPLAYFEQGMTLLDRFDIGVKLKRADINLNEPTWYDQIETAVSKAVTVPVRVKCATAPATGIQYLLEIEICLNKRGKKTIKCIHPPIPNNYECNKNIPVFYPKIPEGFY